MGRLRGKTIAGMGMELGRALFFFDDGTMATVEVEPRRRGELPRDVVLTVSSYEVDDA
jgi:hypothetical protein